MDKAQKTVVVEDLNGVFAEAGSVVVAHYTGMTVAQMSDLRVPHECGRSIVQGGEKPSGGARS